MRYENHAWGAESSPMLAPLDVARQLNRAFVQVARSVSPAVVVVKVAHSSESTELKNENSPYWDLIPPQFRKHLESIRATAAGRWSTSRAK